MKHIKFYVCAFAAVLPSHFFRKFVLRNVLGYQICRTVGIGWGTIINAKEVSIKNGVIIGRFNRFVGLEAIELSSNVSIGSFNLISDAKLFKVGEQTKIGSFNTAISPTWSKNASTFVIGTKCNVTGRHHIDLTHSVEFGDRVTLGGVYSTLWTHGMPGVEGPISIGSGTYIGAGVHIAPNVTVSCNTLVGMGAVVSSNVDQPGCFVGGVPARVIRKE